MTPQQPTDAELIRAARDLPPRAGFSGTEIARLLTDLASRLEARGKEIAVERERQDLLTEEIEHLRADATQEHDRATAAEAEAQRLRTALVEIEDMTPATADMTLAHMMGQIATEALSPAKEPGNG